MKIRLSERVPLEPLDGGGSRLATDFAQLVESHPATRGRRFRKAFEWCSGPGWIGFELLGRGLCERLCCADVNPQAVESLRHTVAENGLADRVSVYLSDNLRAVPDHERFDLVVGNPPNYSRLNFLNRNGWLMRDDPRPNDPDWKIHREFYATIARHLVPGAVLLVSEVEPHERFIHIPKDDPMPYDSRKRAPHAEFVQMIEAGGLDHRETLEYRSVGHVGLWMMVSEYRPGRPARRA